MVPTPLVFWRAYSRVSVETPIPGVRATIRGYFLVGTVRLISRQRTLRLLSRGVRARLGYEIERFDD